MKIMQLLAFFLLLAGRWSVAQTLVVIDENNNFAGVFIAEAEQMIRQVIRARPADFDLFEIPSEHLLHLPELDAVYENIESRRAEFLLLEGQILERYPEASIYFSFDGSTLESHPLNPALFSVEEEQVKYYVFNHEADSSSDSPTSSRHSPVRKEAK